MVPVVPAVAALMIEVQACKLSLPRPSISSSPPITSLLFEPHSNSVALMHSDSSFSLYPSLSPFSPPSPQSQAPTLTLVPPPSSFATFLLLQNPRPNSGAHNPRVLFVVAAPHRAGAAVILRFYVLQKTQLFTKAEVLCTQRDLQFEPKLGVLFNANHGVSVKLGGSINIFAMYSVSNSKIWVFSVKMAGDDRDDGVVLKLMKCAVIDCGVPVFSISVSGEFLILGEENGVRVFQLRPLVKGWIRKEQRESKNLNFPNGCGSKSAGVEANMEIACNGDLEGRIDLHRVSVKRRSVRFRQDSSEGSACFVAFKGKEVEHLKSMMPPLIPVKAVYIQALSAKKFLILDSDGDVHLLCLSIHHLGPEITCHMRQFTNTMKVQKLAVLPDTSTRGRTVWISDGFYSVHMMTVSDTDTSANEDDENDSEEKLKQISVTQAIFASERIQDIIPLAANALLILGQGSLFAYAIS